MNLLTGYKTYAVSVGGILAAIGAYMTGALDMQAAIQAVIGCILAMTIRSGVKTETTK